MGKTMAAKALAKQMAVGVTELSGRVSGNKVLECLRNAKHSDIILFDEAHKLCKENVQPLLMEAIDAISGAAHNKEHKAQICGTPTGSEPVQFAPLTFILATDQPGMLLNAVLKRLHQTSTFLNYSLDEMKEIVASIAAKHSLLLTAQAARMLAKACHGLPRRARGHIQALRLHYSDSEHRQLGKDDVESYFSEFGIDKRSLNREMRAYMRYLAECAPLSLSALASHLGLDPNYVVNEVEGPLRKLRLIVVRRTGRELTNKAKRTRLVAKVYERMVRGEL
jgi:Holliday junction resolvasome RuvABC ATP-dependent DNA helicase subunit